MNWRYSVLLIAAFEAGMTLVGDSRAQAIRQDDLEKIRTIVVIYAENRSFDSMYGRFPGANGLQNVTPESSLQADRDGSVLKELPPVWGGLAAGITQQQTAHLPNRPFAIDNEWGFRAPIDVPTRDLWHRFYQHQMQINGGKNDRFVAYGDSGALVMGYYDGSKLPLWNIAKKYALADNFFMGAFGGSLLNHFWLVCACTPYYPNADQTAAKREISVVDTDGVSLALAANSPKSATNGIPIFVRDGELTPDFYAVNTMQPPYQPSGNRPAEDGDERLADPGAPTTLPPQHEITIGDLMSDKGVTWAWYAGAWQIALDGKNAKPAPNFQTHHQPFNYFANYAPGTEGRQKHLKDGGLNGEKFIQDIDAGKLPQVSFYKPQGNLNQHPGYAEIMSGDEHIADIVAHLERSPQWENMLVIVSYDESGGFWDHVSPPKADRWGPGSRVPTLIVSPFARKGFVDSTQYDTTSIIRFISRRFGLPTLPGIKRRDDALASHGARPMGDLTPALVLNRQ